MNDAEVTKLEADPRRDDKLRLRAWDHAAKRAGWRVPGLETHRAVLLAHVGR